jgi:F-box protein 9
MEDSNPELESFRQQWKAEVTARVTNAGGGSRPAQSSAGPSKASRRPPPAQRIAEDKASKAPDEDDDHVQPQVFSRLDAPSALVAEDGEGFKTASREPRSALEHYEKAVERESQGSLGDSLDLYRKAYKVSLQVSIPLVLQLWADISSQLDHRVDLQYKNKHFPPSYFAAKAANANPSNASSTVPNTAHHSLDGPPPTIKELIAGFAGLSIEPAPPAVEGDPAPPCPLASLPEEILVHIFREVAIEDVASFVRLAQVCKRMAYLVATEEQIWRRVCLGSEVGFGAMHYQWQREILGGPLEEVFPDLKEADGEAADIPEITLPLRDTITEALLHGVYSSSWQQMFRRRPRIRFNGCYISTNNYIRPGQASPSQVSWNSPVHIVTYYRYLRFFRDGTVISLLTTTEPVDVVPHLTKELLETHHGGANPHLPSSVMQNALRGRWHLTPAHPDKDLREAEGALCVETEGVGPKYVYRMDLSLRSAGRGARNNKLVWAAFWFHNRLTDDWAEFSRRNEKPLYWSRVKSYGNGA